MNNSIKAGVISAIFFFKAFFCSSQVFPTKFENCEQAIIEAKSQLQHKKPEYYLVVSHMADDDPYVIFQDSVLSAEFNVKVIIAHESVVDMTVRCYNKEIYRHLDSINGEDYSLNVLIKVQEMYKKQKN